MFYITYFLSNYFDNYIFNVLILLFGSDLYQTFLLYNYYYDYIIYVKNKIWFNSVTNDNLSFVTELNIIIMFII